MAPRGHSAMSSVAGIRAYWGFPLGIIGLEAYGLGIRVEGLGFGVEGVPNIRGIYRVSL